MSVWIVLLELQDIANRGSTERVDRLICVTHNGEVAGWTNEFTDEDVLRVVRVLILVDQHVPELLAIARRDLGVVLHKPHGLDDDVVEVHRIRRLQPTLIRTIGAACRVVD